MTDRPPPIRPVLGVLIAIVITTTMDATGYSAFSALCLLPLLFLFVCLLFARFWVIRTLGRRWTTRIIVLPGVPLVRHGPYRFVSHPNYLVVVGEIAVLPLVFGLWQVSLLFSAANAVVLAIRIRAENAALAGAASRS